VNAIGLALAATSAQIVNPASVAPPIAAYSHLAIVPPDATLLVIAGQIGNDQDGKVPPEPEAQYERALRNIAAILASQGASPKDLVKLNIFLVEPLDRERASEIRQAVLGDARPPTTLVYVKRLARPNLMVEIEGMAVRPDGPAQND
jgi:enamine deaminase RidA (YjgF/YER057c/UK114 family)